MKRVLAIATAAVTAFVMFGYNTYAQTCSSTEGTALSSCVTDSVFSCKANYSNCSSLSTALTIEDVTDIAVDRCCSKRTRAQRRACLVVERRKYISQPASGDQRAFFTAARSAIAELRAGDCNGNAYTSGF